MALPKTYRAVARLGWTSDTGDRDGELEQTGRVPADARAADRRPHAAPARLLGGEGRRRARSTRRPAGGRQVEAAGARSPSTAPSCSGARATRPRFEIECSAGTYVRQLVADLGDAYCEELERTAIGHFRLEDADPERIGPAGARRWRSCPSARWMPTRPRRRATAARRWPAPASTRPVRLTHEGELLAIAEPRGDGELQPVVVFARGEGHLAARRRPPPARPAAQGGDRHLRRRAPRPPRGDPRQRHRAHLRPAPAGGDPPRGRAQAGDAVPDQARPDRGAGGRGAGGDPVRPRVRLTQRRGVRRGGADRPARGRAACRWGRTSASARAPRATPEFLASRDEFETRVVPLVEADGGDRLLEPHPRPGGGRRGRRPPRFLGGPFLLEGEVVPRRQARARAGHAHREHRPRRHAWSCPGHGVYAGLGPRPSRRR